jgi:8-oxo-dGTP diphosphatase
MPISDYMRQLREKVGNDLLMMPAVSAIITNEQGEILLQKRSDNLQWSTPGGAIDPGEEPAQALVREVLEETGLEVVPDYIIGVYGGHDHFLTYPNGDAVAIISIVFACHPVGGTLKINDDESLELRYFPYDALPPLHARYETRLQQSLKDDKRAHFR